MLDGAVGTQLQRMNVPMDNTAWAATALHSHPDTVRDMHAQYISAGADIVTTNTFSSARHNLEPLGLGGRTRALNYRAVNLAIEARERSHRGADVLIAGSVSHFGVITGGESGHALHRHARPRSSITEARARSNFREQAECLADAGVDFLILEGTGNMTQKMWLIEECGDAGLPFWVGVRARIDGADGQLKIGYGSDEKLEDGVKQIAKTACVGIALFHSSISATDAGVPVVKKNWNGLIAVYPEAGRSDYTLVRRDASQASSLSPGEFPKAAKKWIDGGARRIVGGCCGINLDYYDNLKSELASHSRSRSR